MSTIDIDISNVVTLARSVLGQAENFSGDIEHFSLPRLSLTANIASEGYAALCRRALVDDAVFATGDQRPLNVAVIDHVTRPDIVRARWSGDSIGIGEFFQHLEAAGLAGSFDSEHLIWQFFSQSQFRGIQMLQAPGQFPPWEGGFPLRNFLHWSYQAADMRLVHAGTLGLNGRGVLLAGAGGSGKSGTTLAGIMHGLTSVGDDYVAIAQDDRGATAYPVMRLMKQDQRGLDRLGIDPGKEAWAAPNWQGKYEFDFADLVAGARAPSLALTAILLPRISAQPKCTITPAPARAGLYGLLPNNLQQLPGGLREGLGFVSGLTRALPAFYLDLGPEPEDIAQTISQFLEDRPL